MRVLFVTAEVWPLAKSGGLADVSRALPMALQEKGVDVRILLPGYPSAIARLKEPHIEASLPALLGVESASLLSGILPEARVPVYLIHAPQLYSRPGGLYQDAQGRDWDDNSVRFAYLGRIAELIASGKVGDFRPDIVHANDWHAGLVPLFLSMTGEPMPATVFTVHNLAFQGNFPPAALERTGVPWHFFNPDGVEFHGQFSFLKTGLRFADKITTVSPVYGREILTPEFGCGLDGLLRARERDLTGILNGIDVECWDPATDKSLPQRYSLSDISGKRACKSAIQEELGLERSAAPLFAFLSRLTHQKMADILAAAIPDMIALGAEIAIAGDGDGAIVARLAELEQAFPGMVAVRPYDEILAHRLQAGADILLSPARFEPCGLTQVYALRYGTLPIVRRTGGLSETVIDTDSATSTATGFAFDDISREGLMEAVSRALEVYAKPLAWRRMQMAAMAQDFSWQSSVAKYLAVYAEASGAPIPRDLEPGHESLKERARTA